MIGRGRLELGLDPRDWRVALRRRSSGQHHQVLLRVAELGEARQLMIRNESLWRTTRPDQISRGPFCHYKNGIDTLLYRPPQAERQLGQYCDNCQGKRLRTTSSSMRIYPYDIPLRPGMEHLLRPAQRDTPQGCVSCRALAGRPRGWERLMPFEVEAGQRRSW